MSAKVTIASANLEGDNTLFKIAQDHTFSYTFPSSPSSGPTLIKTINHGLGYPPAIFAMFRQSSFFSGRTSYLPYNVFTDIIYARVDSSDIKIYHINYASPSTLASRTVDFRIQISLDEIGA